MNIVQGKMMELEEAKDKIMELIRRRISGDIPESIKKMVDNVDEMLIMACRNDDQLNDMLETAADVFTGYENKEFVIPIADSFATKQCIRNLMDNSDVLVRNILKVHE